MSPIDFYSCVDFRARPPKSKLLRLCPWQATCAEDDVTRKGDTSRASRAQGWLRRKIEPHHNRKDVRLTPLQIGPRPVLTSDTRCRMPMLDAPRKKECQRLNGSSREPLRTSQAEPSPCRRTEARPPANAVGENDMPDALAFAERALKGRLPKLARESALRPAAPEVPFTQETVALPLDESSTERRQ
jgi:hypothetical protein